MYKYNNKYNIQVYIYNNKYIKMVTPRYFTDGTYLSDLSLIVILLIRKVALIMKRMTVILVGLMVNFQL